ncbi:MAG: hypothetical protein ACYDDU_13465 [Dermatophilaceae bacterium]
MTETALAEPLHGRVAVRRAVNDDFAGVLAGALPAIGSCPCVG